LTSSDEGKEEDDVSASRQLPGRLGDPSLTLASDPRLDPRLVAAVGGSDEALAAPVSVGPDSSYAEILDYIGAAESEFDAMYAEQYNSLAPVVGVTRRSEVITGVDGNEIQLFIHEPAERKGPLPGILHTHGGGMVMCATADPQYMRWRDELAVMGLCVVGVEFRNAAGKLGNHPFPAGLNDCASGTRWTYQNKDTLGISHVVVHGESGGGNLCLATALKAKQEGWIEEIAGIYSCCPYIAGTYHPAPPALVSWRENEGYQLEPRMCQALVKAYDPKAEHANNPLAWPYQAKTADLTGLPPHAISVNELDPLRDEGLGYARRLMAAGVPTLSRTVNGTYHGGDTETLAFVPDVCRATIRDIHGFAASL
jgi:acetyl esterase/lipase